MRLPIFVLAAALALPAAAQIAPSRPETPAAPADVPAARDVAYPGTLHLEIDARDTTHGIYRVVETIPVAASGPMTLLYPQWLPGNHAPSGPINSLAGLVVTADGRPVAWRRDPAYVYAFHVDVPAGAHALRLEFQHLSPTAGNQGRISMTSEMLNLQWEKMSLYPAGYFTRDIPIEASVTIPEGWTAATSLEAASSRGNRIAYRAVPYETLVDSPLFAGRYVRRERLAEGIMLDLFADAPGDLQASEAQIAAHRRLAEQALRLYGARHFDHYEFLLALTDELGGIGLEHLRSSENSQPANYFTDWNSGFGGTRPPAPRIHP